MLEAENVPATSPTLLDDGESRSAKGLSAVADERCWTDKLDGVIKHRSSRETTMVGRGASLDGRLFLGKDRSAAAVLAGSRFIRVRMVAFSGFRSIAMINLAGV
jgi:hypothetical protein